MSEAGRWAGQVFRLTRWSPSGTFVSSGDTPPSRPRPPPGSAPYLCSATLASPAWRGQAYVGNVPVSAKGISAASARPDGAGSGAGEHSPRATHLSVWPRCQPGVLGPGQAPRRSQDTWRPSQARPDPHASCRPACLTCVASRLARAFVHAFQLGHPVLQGLHAALHAVCLLPVLPEGTDLLVELFQFLCLAVYDSLPNQRVRKATHSQNSPKMRHHGHQIPASQEQSRVTRPAAPHQPSQGIISRAHRHLGGHRYRGPQFPGRTERPHPPPAAPSAPTLLCASLSLQDTGVTPTGPSQGLYPQQG